MSNSMLNYHIIPLTAPVDIAGAASNTDIFDAGECTSASIIILLGALDANHTLTLEECDDTTPSNSTAIAFKYRLSSAVGTDSMGAITDATSSGITINGTNDDNKVVEVIVDPAALADGFPYVRAVVSGAGSANLLGAVAHVLPRKNPPNSMVD